MRLPAFLLLVMPLLASCADVETLSPVRDPTQEDAGLGSELAARGKLAELRQQGASMPGEVVVRHADGRFAFVRSRLGKAGKRTAPVAIDGRGRISHLRDAEAVFRREHERDWGKLGLESATMLHGLAPHEAVDALAWYDRNAASVEEIEAFVQRIDPAASVRRSPDRILLTATRSEIVRLAQAPFVTHVVVEQATETTALASPPTHARDSTTFSTSPPYMPPPSSDSTPGFNQLGYFGEGVAVGMIEGRENCGIWFDENNSANRHDRFGYLRSMTHMNSNLACTISGLASCATRCGATSSDGTSGACQNEICVEAHGNRVAGQIASTVDDEPYHAAKVDLFFANVGSNVAPSGSAGTINISPSMMEDAIDWLLGQEPQVRIVNHSFDTGSTLIRRESMLDWYARYKGMTFVVASGNGETVVDCNTLNTICVGASDRGTNAPGPKTGSGSNYPNYHDQTVANFSNWQNSSSNIEVEKPDIVAIGAGVQVAKHDGDPDAAEGWNGTSFAVPVVTGYLALLTEYCWKGVVQSPLVYRTLLRAAAWSPHSFDADSDPDTPCPASVGINPLFPTAAYGCDYRAGVGSLDTRHLLVFCGEANEECGESFDEPCVEYGEEHDVEPDDPRWVSIGDYPHLETADPEEFLDNAFALTRDDRGSQAMVLKSWGSTLDAGTRIRFAFAYNSCPTSPSFSTFSSVAAVNFDVALCGRTVLNSEEKCIFISESLHDTNEGFDVLLPEDLYAVDLLVIGPRDNDDPAYWPECNDGNGRVARAESWAWALAWWGPGVW